MTAETSCATLISPGPAGIVARRRRAEMAGAAAHPGQHADVLEPAVGIGEPRADRSDVRREGVGHEPIEPAVAQDSPCRR